jgi:hypothetical protein
MRKSQRSLCLLCLGILTLALAAPSSFSPFGYRESPDDQPDPRRLLEQVVNDVLTNPDLEGAREFYGTPGDKRVALLKESRAIWPKNWRPSIAGYDIQYVSEEKPVEDFVYLFSGSGVEKTSVFSLTRAISGPDDNKGIISRSSTIG